MFYLQINTRVGSFSSSSHSPSKEEFERSLNARISSAYSRTITPPPPTIATQQDLSQLNVPVLDHVHHISIAPIPVDIKQVDENDIYDCINNSPKILTTLLSYSEASQLVKETFIGQTEHENVDDTETARLQSDDNNNVNNNYGKLEREETAASLEDNHHHYHHHRCQICGKTFGSRSSLKV